MNWHTSPDGFELTHGFMLDNLKRDDSTDATREDSGANIALPGHQALQRMIDIARPLAWRNFSVSTVSPRGTGNHEVGLQRPQRFQALHIGIKIAIAEESRLEHPVSRSEERRVGKERNCRC